MKKVFFVFLGIIFSGTLFLFLIYCFISFRTKDFLFDDLPQIPSQKVGVVLGTTPWTTTGMQNLYFVYRMDASEALYKSGKVQYLLLSGDNGTPYYNEPLEMKKNLIARGIPENRLILDYAGFRTYDSVLRAKEVFGQNSYILISQKFQNERALFIASAVGVSAVAYNAKDVQGRASIKTNVREIFARVNMFWDLMVGTDPKYLGEKITIGD